MSCYQCFEFNTQAGIGVPSLFYITESVANDLSRSVLCSSTPSHPATVSLEKLSAEPLVKSSVVL